MTDRKTYDWPTIGRAHGVLARQIEAAIPALEAASRALHVERCAADAYAAAVAQRAQAAAEALEAARRNLRVSRTIMYAQTGHTWALEYLLGHRADDDAFQAAEVRGLVRPDGTLTRDGLDIIAAINATNKDDQS